MIELRDYQAAAIDAIAAAWSDGHTSPVLALPTGAGKTIAAGMLLRQIRDDGGPRAAWLTDRTGLVDTTRAEMEACGLRVAVVRAPEWQAPPPELAHADCLLVMSQTATRRDWLPEDLDIGVAIVDEAHVERAVTRRWLETGIPMVGLTATPFPTWMHDARDRVRDAWSGPLVAPLTTRRLIDQGRLLAPVMRTELEDPTVLQDPLTGRQFARSGPDWSGPEAESIMDPYTTMIATRWRELCDAPLDEGGYGGEQPPTLVLAATVDHARTLADAFRRLAGPGRIWSVLSQHTRDPGALLRQARAGEVHGLVSVHMLTVGVDLPAATIGVCARPTRSLTTWVQWLGRFMRVGSARPTIQDWGGTAQRLVLETHDLWMRGPQWPPRQAQSQLGGSKSVPSDAMPEPCPYHPRVLHQPGTAECSVCGRPLSFPKPVRPDVRTRFRADRITLSDIGRSVLRLAQDRACRPPLDEGVTARRWARAMVRMATGRPPRRDWPGPGWRDTTRPDPHPLVARAVKRAARAYAEWMATPEDERPERPSPVPTLGWVDE